MKKKNVQVWFTPEQLELLRRAAATEGRSMTLFLFWHGLQAVRNALKISAREVKK